MALLRSNNVCLQEDGQLSPLSGSFGNCALFKASPGEFEFGVRLRKGSPRFMVGIAKSDINVNTRSLFHSSGYYVFADGMRLYAEGKIINTALGLPQSSVALGQELRLHFSPVPVPALRVALNAGSFVSLPFQVSAGDYRPCVLFDREDTVLDVLRVYPDLDVQEHRSKRSRQMMGEMWGSGTFSDCRVLCGDASFPCHRIVLATASPVWRAALDGNFKEGRDAVITIQDAEPSAVEALLRYAYTSAVDGADVAGLMPLAHRYEMPGLVALCGNMLLDRLSAENVAQSAFLLHRYKEHEEINTLWHRVVLKVHLDPKLCEAALSSVRP